MATRTALTTRTRTTWILVLSILVLGCDDLPTLHDAQTYPLRLSAWGLVSEDLGYARASIEYDLNTSLFSDYASKLRTLYVPEGKLASFHDFEAFDFPTGTMVTKTFYYQANNAGHVYLGAHDGIAPDGVANGDTVIRPIETRLLIKQHNGWDALPYVWRGDDAYLAITGELIYLQSTSGKHLPYLVPSKNQCASCHAANHTTGEIRPLGLKARHLNRPHPIEPDNQLALLAAKGWLQGLPSVASLPKNAVFQDSTESIDHRARSYLDINCGHCHNPQGPADTSGLLLDYQDHDVRAMGECKPPIGAGRGSGGLNYAIVPGQAELSILSARMASRDPAVMMPELGRSLVDTQGVSLIDQWINQMQGVCR